MLGKTGTAVRFVNGRYVRGQYTASFAAIFPADHPQLVVIVKIDNPRGNYYGGLTAAPVTRTMLQQALASRRVAIDRGPLAARDSTVPEASQDRAAPAGAPPVVITLPYRPPETDADPAAGARRRGPVGPRGRARAAPARIPGDPARTRHGSCAPPRGRRDRAWRTAVLVEAE